MLTQNGSRNECKNTTMKHLKENLEENFCDLGLGIINILAKEPKIMTEDETDKLDFIKTKNLCSLKDTTDKNKQRIHKLGEIFVNGTSD